MCLNNVGEMKTAEKDIICYKVLRDYNGDLFTIYQSMHVHIEKSYRFKLIKNYYREVHEGFHSYTSLRSSRRFHDEGSYVIVKCIIPMRSHYYIGNFDGNRSYASNKIKYLEIVK
jgi:hypothetical protein